MQFFSNEDARNAPEHFAMGYVYYKDEYLPVPYMDFGRLGGDGGIISNVLDSSKWIKAIINASGPISKAGHKAIKSSRTLIPEEEDSPYTGISSYALGWEKSVRITQRLESTTVRMSHNFKTFIWNEITLTSIN